MNDTFFGIRSNRFGFTLAAMPGQVIVVECSSNLLDWATLQTNATPDAGASRFVDAARSNYSRRFYRARLQ